MNKYFFLSLLCCVVFITPHNVYAQTARNKQKMHVPYRDNYQRIGASSSAYGTFEIRSGQLWACGYNLYGQLGIGSTTASQTSFVQVGLANNWVAVHAAYEHTIGLRSDGTLWAAGDNTYGQLGIGSTTSQTSFVQVGTDNKWVTISCNDQFNAAIKSDGTLWTWGNNASGQLGIGSTTNQSSPVQVGTDTKWVLVQTGGDYVIGLKSDGTLWSWGRNLYGQLGDGTTTNRTSPVQIGSQTNWISIAAGYGHCLAVKTDGTLWVWGDNSNGQLGIGNTTNQSSPTQVGSANTWVSISGGGFHSLALKADGGSYGWGKTSNGELGTNSTAIQTSPMLLYTLTTDWLQISTGDLHTLALKSDGTLWAWGSNSSGQLGNGTTTSQLSPIQVGTATNWIAVSAGGNHSIALKSDGTLWAWGSNSWGQLGIGSTTSQSSPTQVGTGTTWKCISTGYYHSVALKNDGTVWAWGYGFSGQLGGGSYIGSTSPIQGGTNTTWVSVSGGADHSMALRSDGTIWGTGSNSFGDMGQGSSTSSQTTWTQTGTANNWITVIAGGGHSIGLQSNGDLYTWGWNQYGQVGVGTSTTSYYTPQLLSSASDAIQICAKWFCASYIKSDGTMRAFGLNTSGQLGDGTVVNRNVPVTVSGVTGAVSIASNSLGNLTNGIIKSYRTEYCLTGSGALGQLGNGATASRNIYGCGLPPSITSQPSNSTICAGDNTTFTVSASNSPTNYTWQVNTGFGYTNISNGGVYSTATTATLTITGAPATMNGYLYRVIATNSVGSSANSNAVTLTVNALPTITGQPTNSSVSSGGSTSFTVVATGAGITYQWQENAGSGFVNIVNGGIYSNATTATLNLTGVTLAMNSYQYRCVVTGTCTPPATSNGAILTVSATAPAITLDPGNSTICSGSNTTFTVAASNSPTNYTWQVNTGSGYTNIANGGVYSTATTATLTITAATSGMNGYLYRAIASNSGGNSLPSNAASLTVNTIPVVSTQPVNSIICTGANTSFSVVASNVISYQWQEFNGSVYSNLSNGGAYSGVATATLTVTGGTTINGYGYRCTVTNSCGSSNSSTATLTVNSAPSITTQPINSAICSGSNTSFSIVAGNATSYQWQENQGSGFVNIANGGVFAGATSASLNLTGVVVGMNGYIYRCIVSGTCTPIAVSTNATLTVNTGAGIISQPISTSACAGNNANFSVTVSGGSSYQWQEFNGSVYSNLSNGGAYAGTGTANLTVTASAGINGYGYRCVVTSSCGSPNSNTAILTVNTQPSVATQPTGNVICSGSNISFSIVANNATSYQWQENQGSGFVNIVNGGIYSGATLATLSLTGVPLGMNGYVYRCIASGACTPVATSSSASLTVNAGAGITSQPTSTSVCAGTNAGFSVVASGATSYQWQEFNGSAYSNLSNGGAYSGVATATLTVTGSVSINGYGYRCIVTSSCGSPNSNTAILTVNSAPTITIQPANSTICSGSNTTFNVVANNATSYQWQENQGSGFVNIVNGSVYSGGTTSTLSITGAIVGMNGYVYRCVVSGICTPVVTSTNATLTVNAGAGITSQPTSTSVCVGNNASFSVVASGATAYRWQEFDGVAYSNLSNGGAYSGVATTTLTVIGSVGINGYGYRCVVTNGCGSPISNTAILTVNSSPTITTQPLNSTICSGANASFSVVGTNVTSYQWQENAGSGFVNISNGGIYGGAATGTLSLTGAIVGMNGYQYRCVVAGVCTPVVVSSNAALTVNTSASINTQPVNSAICSGGNTSFSVVATGANSYQWQENTGGGFVNITNGGIYSGSSSATLTLTGVLSTMNGYLYRCVVVGTCTPAANTNNAALTVNTGASITTQPSNATVCAGSNATFTIVAIGAASYQWQEFNGSVYSNLSNGGAYSGVTTASLSIVGNLGLNGFGYRCVVSSTCSSPNSNTATLSVNALPSISVQPANSTICSGSNTSFTVTAGNVTSYQWQVNTGAGFVNLTNTVPYSNVTTATLNITNATTALNTFQYRVVASGICAPAVISSGAQLVVNTSPVITSQPANSVICQGDNTLFTVAATGTSLSYQWQVDAGSGFTNLSNVAPYSNVTTATLSMTSVSATYNNYQYRVVVSGACTPSIISSASLLTVNTAPTITTQPVNVVICAGANTSFTVAATGTAIVYQWQVNTGSGFSNLSNSAFYSNVTTSTLNIAGSTSAFNGNQYRVVVSGTCAPVAISSAASLTVNALPAIVSAPVNTAVCAGGNASFAVTATGTGLLYQWQVNTGAGYADVTNGGVYSGATTSILNITGALAVMSGNSYRVVISGTCPPVIMSTDASLTVNTPPAITGQPINKTVCAGSTTTFQVYTTGSGLTYQWQENTGSGFVSLTNSVPYSGVTTSSLVISGAANSMNGNRYRVVVNGICPPSVISQSAVLTVDMLPTITSQSATSVFSCPGAPTTFSISAIGAGLAYQWQVNTGTGFVAVPNLPVYSGANSPTLTILPTISMNGYLYRVVVSGNCPPVAISSIMTLNVYNPVAIVSQMTSDSACSGWPTRIGLRASGGGLMYQWQIKTSSGYTNLSNIPPYSGTNTDSLRISATPDNLDGSIYRCVVKETILCNYTLYSADIPLAVTQSPKTTPDNLTVRIYGSATFTVPNNSTDYQWQENNNKGGGFMDLAESNVYKGVKTNTLNINPVSLDMSSNLYRCIVSGVCYYPLISTQSTLLVDPAVTVNHILQPGMNYITVYPNPTTDEVNIKFDKPLKGETEIGFINKLGQVILKGIYDLSEHGYTKINLSQLTPGVYTIQIINQTESINVVSRVTKQ